MSNPAIAARFPRRQRRGSAPAIAHGHTSQQHGDTSPSSASGSCRSEASAATGGAHQERGGGVQAAGGRNGGGRHHAAAGSGSGGHSTSAKNPFAATPKNIRQQQLLCNLMAAADSFTEGGSGGPSAPAAGAGAGSRPSLDCSAMPPPCPPGRPSVDRASLDMTMSRATSRTSLESWGYMQRGRNSCDLNGAAANRASMDSYSASMRSSMDRASCWSGRPSVDSTFSAYAPPSSLAQQQQQQVAATAAAAAAAAAVAARASFEAALPPNPTGNTISRMGMWQAGRASCDLGALSPAAMPASAFSRYSLDSGADSHAAAAAVAAAASAMQMEQQQRSLSGLLRFDSSAMSNVSSGSMDSASTPCPPSPATSAELAAAAAAMAARRTQMAQLQNIIDSMGAAASGISGETAAALATLTAQGVSPDTAALLLFQAQQNAAAAASNGVAPEALLFQQQLQQIMQANQVAAANSAAAQAAAASQLYAASVARSHASQQRQQSRQCWQNLGFNAADAELLQEQEAQQMPATYDADALLQQLEALQCMQL